MGQTLTHGVYLPDEGERNCYSGLAANWQLLDGAVGTIAEHTSALLGKAPLVHTHTVSDITDFPAYGTTAGTICEGNDSRLSDARTPVAHTHTKSDVTDLFNSANTWTGDNTYTKYQNIVLNDTEIGVAPNVQNRNGLLFKDKNGVNIGWLRHQYDTSGNISFEMLVSNKYKNGALDPTGTQVYQGVKQVLTSNGVSYFNWSGYVNNSLSPFTTETFNIGDSTHQWNNLYAKNYYYNGVAWGLDKLNVWGNTQIVTGGNDKGWNVINPDLEKGVIPSTAKSSFAWWSDKNNTYLGRICSRVNTDGTTILWLSSLNYYKNGALDPTGSSLTTSLVLGVDANAYKFVQTNADFRPDVNNVYNLGTSTNKWKSLNGINPGALSLPNARSGVQIDITNWDNRASPNGLIGNFTAPVDCIVSIQMTRDVDWGVWVICGNFRQSFRSADNNGTHLIFLTFPVAKGEGIGIYCPPISSDETPITFIANKQLYFPCLGNV